MSEERQLTLALIREHCDGTDESFREAALNLAKYYDQVGRSVLAEYIFAYLFPQMSFTTFEPFYCKGQIIETEDVYGQLIQCKIVSVDSDGVFARNLKEQPDIAYFIPFSSLSKNWHIVKSE